MKKVILIALMAIVSTGIFANTKNQKRIVTNLTISHVSLKNTNIIKAYGFHLGGTYTSSCGDVWNIDYTCNGCGVQQILSEVATLFSMANNACGTSITEVSLD